MLLSDQERAEAMRQVTAWHDRQLSAPRVVHIDRPLPPIDTRVELKAIEAALSDRALVEGIKSVAKSIGPLMRIAEHLADHTAATERLIKTIAAIKMPQPEAVSGVISELKRAVESNTAATETLAQVMAAPKEIKPSGRGGYRLEVETDGT